MKKLVGIISYLPQRWGKRKERIVKLNVLISTVNRLFNLPILILAQNYKEEDYTYLTNFNNNLVFLKYDKPLGITGAREELRKQFLSTDYEVIILLDDDCEVMGNDGTEYLKQLEAHPGKLCTMDKSLHKLMAIHRDVYKLQEYDLVNTPEARLAYEDRLYFWTLLGKHPELHYRFNNVGIEEISVANNDNDSSWAHDLLESERKDMNVRTDKLIEERTGRLIKPLYNLLGYPHK